MQKTHRRVGLDDAFFGKKIQIHLGASLPSGIGKLGSILSGEYSKGRQHWLDRDGPSMRNCNCRRTARLVVPVILARWQDLGIASGRPASLNGCRALRAAHYAWI